MTNSKIVPLVSLLALSLGSAQGLAEESMAKDWGLTNAELARVDGKVVDVLCSLSGDCPDNCGEGARQLGIETADGKIHLAAKNTQAAFNGAVTDLLPYCGKDVQADGVLAGHSGVTFYHVQLIREDSSQEWSKTNLWTRKWNDDHPDVAGQEGPWFRKDPRVLSRIEQSGFFGLGQDVDDAYIEEWK